MSFDKNEDLDADVWPANIPVPGIDHSPTTFLLLQPNAALASPLLKCFFMVSSEVWPWETITSVLAVW